MCSGVPIPPMELETTKQTKGIKPNAENQNPQDPFLPRKILGKILATGEAPTGRIPEKSEEIPKSIENPQTNQSESNTAVTLSDDSQPPPMEPMSQDIIASDNIASLLPPEQKPEDKKGKSTVINLLP